MTRRPTDDGGATLVELLVGMSLASLVLVVLANVVSSDLRSTTDVRAKTTATGEVRLALDVMSRRLRVATPLDADSPAFVTTGPRDVTFYASLQSREEASGAAGMAADPGLTLVTYAYDDQSGCLEETLTPVDSDGAPTVAARTTCLARAGLVEDVFMYYTAGTGTALATSPGDVRSVGITLALAVEEKGRPSSTTASTRVTCPNTVPRA